MGRQPCCDKVGLKRGPWTIDEDHKLMSFILNNGIHCWRTVPKLAGLLRCGKSCRLRWINYLRPDLKRGDFSEAEETQLIQLHSRLGNKWSKIASHFPGRTDNEIKNHWNTRIKKRLKLLEGELVDPHLNNPPPVEEGLEANNLNSSQNETSKLELVTISQEFEESLENKVVSIEEACVAREVIQEMTIVQPEYHKEHNDDGDSGFESIILDELASTDLLNSYNNVFSCGNNNNLVSDIGLIQDITTNFYNNNNSTTTMSQSCSFSVEDSNNNYSASVGESQDINSRYNLQQQWPLETTVDSYCWDNLDNYLGHEDFFYFQNL